MEYRPTARTAASEAVNLGSNPSIPTNQGPSGFRLSTELNPLWSAVLRGSGFHLEVVCL